MEFLLLFIGFVALTGWTFWIWWQLEALAHQVETLFACVRALETQEQTRRFRESTPSWSDHHQP